MKFRPEFFLLVLPLCYGIYQTSDSARYYYQTKWFDNQIDHFGFAINGTFKQKYLINDTWWEGKNGPIFLYAGNEGDIEAFAQNTGFMWDIAPEFGALVIFIEHRYYGQSLPFGNKSLEPDPIYNGYLTSEQALADYAYFLDQFKRKTPGSEKSPVIVFGGSYGGMLAAWFRIKYPHIVDGAIAASAPVAQFDAPCDAFGRIVTSDYSVVTPVCSDMIRNSWKAIDKLSKSDDGLTWLQKTLKLCQKPQKVDVLKGFLTDVWTNIAMLNYPYPTNFLMPLPGNPVQYICNEVTANGSILEVPKDDKDIILAISRGLNVYTNYTGKETCLNLNKTDNIGADMWDYQSCTEMVMPFCYDNVNDMFEKTDWNFTEYKSTCQTKWDVSPNERMADVMYGSKRLEAASNIVFSNGLLDPWSSGGIVHSISKTVVAIIIPEGAHHLDLRGADPADPISVVHARKLEKSFIRKWIKQARTNRNKPIRGPDVHDIVL